MKNTLRLSTIILTLFSLIALVSAQGAGGAGGDILSFLLFIILLAVIIGIVVFWLMMIVNCVERDFRREGDKISWTLINIFLGIIGALLYYYRIKKKSKR